MAEEVLELNANGEFVIPTTRIEIEEDSDDGEPTTFATTSKPIDDKGLLDDVLGPAEKLKDFIWDVQPGCVGVFVSIPFSYVQHLTIFCYFPSSSSSSSSSSS